MMNKNYKIFVFLLSVVGGLLAFGQCVFASSDGYGYFRPITIDHTEVSTNDQASFPILVCFNGNSPCDQSLPELKNTSDGGHVQNSNGYDIIFTSDIDGNNVLPFELENYVPTTGEAEFWINIPTLSHSTDTTIYMFYGKSGVSSFQGNTTGTWNSDYKGVYHLSTPSVIYVRPTRSSYNPIISHGGTGWKERQVQEPVIIPDPTDNSKLIMFYAAMDGSNDTAIGFATSTVANPESWNEYSGNPVIPGEGVGRRIDAVINVSGTLYLYATENSVQVVLYTSTDNGLTWSRDASSPVLTPDGQECSDETNVSEGSVYWDGGSNWTMIYSYRTNAASLAGFRYATSSDGKTWTKGGCTDILSLGPAGTSDTSYMEWHQIFKIGSTYYLSYEGYGYNSEGVVWSANLAYSKSLTSGWKKAGANPVFIRSSTPGAFDEYHVATPAFYNIGGVWYLFYQGGNVYDPYAASNWDLGMARLPGSPADAAIGEVHDSTSNANDLVAVNLATSSGEFGRGFVFNGTSSYASSPIPGSTATSNFTLQSWIKPNDLDTPFTFVQNGADNGIDGGSGYGIGLNGSAGGGGRLTALLSGITWLDSGSAFVSTSSWHSTAMVRDAGGTIDFYADAVQAPLTYSQTPNAANTNFTIGSLTTGHGFYNGSVDEVRILDTALGADWIATEYNNENSPSTFYTVGDETALTTTSRGHHRNLEYLLYTAGFGGTISGEKSQVVVSGGSGSLVTAVPDPGYKFTTWSDGLKTDSRTDENILASVSFTANFEPLLTSSNESEAETAVSSGASNTGTGGGFYVSTSSEMIGSGSSTTSKFIFNRDLYFTKTESDVKELQKYLNNNGFILAKTGPGSPGQETSYFGILTKNSLIGFQKANKIKPTIGYFGPITRKLINSR